jgi:hypothetical protein
LKKMRKEEALKSKKNVSKHFYAVGNDMTFWGFIFGTILFDPFVNSTMSGLFCCIIFIVTKLLWQMG